MPEGISIILPAINESECIKEVALNCTSFLNTLGLNYELIIVDDGSEDATGQIADELSRKIQKIRVIHHPTNQGYGCSIRDGFKAARYDLLFFTDADRQFNIANLGKMLPLIRGKDADIVVGYRIQRQASPLRKFLSWGFNLLVKIVFDLNVRDINCAFKLFKKEIFSRLEIESQQFLVNAEILAKSRFFGCNILELGVEHFPRVTGRSKISFKYIFTTLSELLRIRRSIHRLKKDADKKLRAD